MVDDEPSALSAELQGLEEELAELRREAKEARRRIGEEADAPGDEADVAAALTAVEEQEAILRILEDRVEVLRQRLGQRS
jgi:hypothetical protein